MKIPDFVNPYLSEPGKLIQISDHVFGIENNIEESKKNIIAGNKKIILFSGLSGSGKDTIMERLMADGKKYKRVKTCTTRPRRMDELEQNDPHVRITKEELKMMMTNGSALECAEYAGNFYCTSRSEIEKVLNENKIPLLRVDPQGARFFIEARRNGHNFLKDFDFTYIFMIPTSFLDLRERLVLRGSSALLIDERIKQSKIDIGYINDAQYIVVNEFGVLDPVINEVLKLLE